MNALHIAVSSSTQPQQNRDQDHHQGREASFDEAFASRAAGVNKLIDEKARLVMNSSRLRSLVESNPEDSQQCFSLIQELNENIERLQQQIDRELKGLFYGLQKAPAPSPFMDDLPG